jgi:hypothetical protein
LIIDPERKTVEVGGARDGRFRTILSLRETGRVDSEVMTGFSMDVASLFAGR